MTDDLETALRNALKPVEPDAGFTARVLSTIDSATPPAQLRRFYWTRYGIAASLIGAVGVLIGVQYHEHQIQAGLTARSQLLNAMHITGEKLDMVYQTVNDKDSDTPAQPAPDTKRL